MTKATGEWSDTEVAGHPCEVFEPATPSQHGYAVIYLHGVHLGKLRRHAAFNQQLDRFGLRCLAPQAGRCWWVDRICPEFDPKVAPERYVVDHMVHYAAERWGTTPPQIALFGTSMGGQGALRMAYKHPQVFPVVAALAPAIDVHQRMEETTRRDEDYAMLHLMYREPEQARQDSATLHVHPLNWPRNQFFACDPTDLWWESADRLHMKLSSLGVPHDCDLETEAGGHGFGYYTAMAEKTFEWMADKLERERLRLPVA